MDLNNNKKSMIDHTGRNLYLILIPNSVTDQNDLTQLCLAFHFQDLKVRDDSILI
jgi:hypothetical protein